MRDGIGQDIPIEQAMIVIFDRDGQAHGWNVTDGVASWRFTDIGDTGRSIVDIEISGQMHRRTKPAEMLETIRGRRADFILIDDPYTPQPPKEIE